MTLDKEALEAATKVRHDLAEKGLEKFGITPLSWEALEQEYKDEDMASMSAAITAYLDKSGIAEELKQLRSAVKYCAQQLSTADHIFSKVVRVTVTVEEEKP